jgi:hypothetical protein
MNTAEYALPLYPVQDTGPGTGVRRRRSAASDDPLADTDAQGRPAVADRRLPRRAAPADGTGRQRRGADRNRPEPTNGSPRVGRAGSAAVAEPADPAWTNPVPADRAIANAGQRSGQGQLDRAVDDADSPEIQALDRQLRSPGKPRKSGGPKPRKRPGAGKSRPRAGRRRARKVLILAGSVIVAVLAVAGYVVFRPQASHAVSTPATLGSYARQQANATAKALKQRIVATGDVKNVVAAVYQRATGPGTSTGPQIVVFIGGNLAGNASASSLISAFMTRLHGAFATSAGQLGGQAACAPGSNGGLAECTWADSDTFGVVVSATLTSTGLADEMRQMRPLIEHAVK